MPNMPNENATSTDDPPTAGADNSCPNTATPAAQASTAGADNSSNDKEHATPTGDANTTAGGPASHPLDGDEDSTANQYMLSKSDNEADPPLLDDIINNEDDDLPDNISEHYPDPPSNNDDEATDNSDTEWVTPQRDF